MVLLFNSLQKHLQYGLMSYKSKVLQVLFLNLSKSSMHKSILLSIGLAINFVVRGLVFTAL
jgi:hypothetical protein